MAMGLGYAGSFSQIVGAGVFVADDVMRLLIVSDKIEPTIYRPGAAEHIGPVDLLISCGDLPFYYLDYLATTFSVPLLFVHGNHGYDVEYKSDGSVDKRPQIGVNLHNRTVCERGLLLAGLEGSMRYNNNPRFQYTDSQMLLNVLRLAPQLWLNRLHYGRFLDVLVTHAPPYGIHDESDRCHTGFKAFLTFMRWFKPRYIVHGHIHIYRSDTVTRTRYLETDVINVYPYKVLQVDIVSQPGKEPATERLSWQLQQEDRIE